MTALRKPDQDGLWEGIRERQSFILPCLDRISHKTSDSFDDFWRVAGKLWPSPVGFTGGRPGSPSGFKGSAPEDSAYSMRSAPIRIYLPDGPVVQEVAPPILEDGAFGHLPSRLRGLNPDFYRCAKHTWRISLYASSFALPC